MLQLSTEYLEIQVIPLAKTYLNKQERDDCLVMGAFIAWFREKADFWASLKRPKDIIKSMRAASSLGDRALQAILTPLDEHERVRVLEENAKMRVSTRYTDQAIKDFREICALDTVTPLEKGELEDILEYVFDANCTGCYKQGTEAHNCKWKKRLIKWDIEPFVFEVPDGACPYVIIKEGNTNDNVQL